MFKKSMVVLMVICTLAIMAYGMIGSGAWFTDTATSQTNTLYSGTLSIDDGLVAQTQGFEIPNMAPGDKTGDVVIVIKNNGNIPLAWFGDLVIEGSSKMQEAVYIDYALMQFEGGTWAEVDDNFILDGRGAGPYPTWYNTLANMSPFNVITLNNWEANMAMGASPYEFKGALKPGYNYRLTLRFGFAEGAGNDYQTKGPLTLKFKVDATQVTAGALDATLPGQSGEIAWFNTQLNNQVGIP